MKINYYTVKLFPEKVLDRESERHILYRYMYNTVSSRKRAHYGVLAHPPLWAQFPAKV